ncbi:MAG: GNAT family N-acetyltransferase [bacterium]
MLLPKIITITTENIDKEHICCAIGDKKHEKGLFAKKEWIKKRLKDGFVFKKADVRGKAFIQYVPAENAWAPIKADGYMFIECFWVAGQFAGKGIGKALLEECKNDSKDMKGIVTIVGNKKKPYLNDKAFLKKIGFEVCDASNPYFELMVYKNNLKSENPVIKKCAKVLTTEHKNGILLYYSNACPFTEYYKSETERLTKEKGMKIKVIKIETKEDAQNAPIPFTINAVFNNGNFVCHEMLTETKFKKVMEGVCTIC